MKKLISKTKQQKIKIKRMLAKTKGEPGKDKR